MAYSDNFPATRPVFQADFANGGKIDPRATFSRSDTTSSGDWNASTNLPGLVDGSGTTNQYYRVSVAGTQDLGSGSITYAVGDYVKYSDSVWFKTTQPIGVTYWSNEKHLSSENLLKYSNDVSQSNWIKDGFSATGGQTAPDGGTDAYKLTENTANDEHRIYQASSERITSSGSLTVSVYLKYIGRQWAVIRITDSTGTDRRVWFDIQNGLVGSTNSEITASISASGNGYYKCVATISSVAPSPGTYVMIGGADADNTYVYTGSGADAFAVWGIQASTTGESVLNETSGQIHRTYAPSLKYVTPATGGQPRFEYDPAADGQSVAKGILIEGQSTNLYPYGSEQYNWSGARRLVQSNAAVSPAGTLTADLVTLNGDDANTHYVYQFMSVTSGTTYTISQYVKAAGLNYIALRPNTGFVSNYVYFDLSNGTVTSNTGGLGATIDSIGNGWYRVSVTATANATVSNATCAVYFMESSSSLVTATGDSYRGILLWGAQWEASSFASSLVDTGTSSSTATRAAESLSVATADITGFSEGVGTVVYETGGVASSTATNQLAFGLRADSANFFTAGVNNGGVSDASVRVYSKTSDGDQAFLNPGTATVGTGYKLACRFELDNIAASMNGGAVVSDTSGKVPVGVNTLWVGQLAGNFYLNSNIKRIALYNEALSDTNLQALTS